MDNPYAVGQTLYLRHPSQQDVDGAWPAWFSDEETTRFMNLRFWPNCRESQQVFYDSLIGKRDSLVLSVIDRKTNTHIGICSLSAINWVHRYADVALVLGDKRFRKGATAFEAGSLILRIAFRRLNLRVIKGAYYSTNEFTRCFLRVCGFRDIGAYEKLVWDGQDYVDLVHTMITQEEWLANGRQS